MQGGFQHIPPEVDVNFLMAFQSGDFSFTPNTSEITVNTGGVYRIDYSLLVRPTSRLLNIAYAVAINGLENPLSFFGTYLPLMIIWPELGLTTKLSIMHLFYCNESPSMRFETDLYHNLQ